MNLGTLLDGIASSEHLDSSGERISIKGIDISSLPTSGVFTFEHKNDNPSQTVGKILAAKKIFSEADCENERHLYFWNKINVPYVYVMGELFDAVGHESAKEIAAMLRYDSAARKAGRKADNVINFSVEGSKLDTQGSDIKRSIARKVTLAVFPCNKQAIAEEIPKDSEITKKSKQTNSLLKNEDVSVEFLEKSDYSGSAMKTPAGLWSMNQPATEQAPKPVSTPKPAIKPVAPPSISGKGNVIGKTKTGKDVFSQSHARDYRNFSSADHSDAMNHHYNTAMDTKDYKEKNHHLGQAKFHSAFRDRKDSLEQRPKQGWMDRQNIKKADVAPSLKTGNVALTKEKIDGIYKTFEKKSELEKRIKAKHPTLNKHEVLALAKMVVYKKEEELEETLAKLKV